MSFRSCTTPSVPVYRIRCRHFRCSTRTSCWSSRSTRTASVSAADSATGRRQLEGLERAELPTDRSRDPGDARSAAACRSTVPAEVLAALKRTGRTQHMTLYMTLLAGMALLLHRYTQCDDVAVGTPVTDRRDVRMEELIGCFVNVIVLRIRARPSMRIRELLAEVRRTAVDAVSASGRAVRAGRRSRGAPAQRRIGCRSSRSCSRCRTRR